MYTNLGLKRLTLQNNVRFECKNILDYTAFAEYYVVIANFYLNTLLQSNIIVSNYCVFSAYVFKYTFSHLFFMDNIKKVFDTIDITKDRPDRFTQFASWFLFIVAILLGISVIVAILFIIL